MKTFNQSLLARSLAFLLITFFAVSPAWATCGGGGGGGGGGMSGGGGGSSAAETYPVPWKIRTPKDPAPKGLIVYWFPASADELKRSSLRMSRPLSLYASQCISMELADNQVPNAQQLVGEAKLPVAVIATPDGTPVTRVENTGGKLKVEALEKVLTTEVKTRESALDELSRPKNSTSAPVCWIRLIRRRCVTWVSFIAITPAIGIKRAQPSTRYFICRLTRFPAQWLCMVWARSRFTKASSKRDFT